MIAATIVARNYVAQARVLAASFLQHHPGPRFVTLVIDGDETDLDASTPPSTVVLPGDLGLAPGEWEQMAGMYSLMEFATAMKPALLRALLTQETASRGEDASVLYLDPDIVVSRPFAEVFSAAQRSGIALTPHVLHALPRDGLEPDEAALMHAGVFNLGFICVGRGAVPFLDWWHERLRVDAVVDLANALFTDQRWVDWVPTLFGADVLRDHGLNVAYWNLHERPLTRDADGTILAAGEALKFFHFSGYDPERPWLLSKHTGDRPRCPTVRTYRSSPSSAVRTPTRWRRRVGRSAGCAIPARSGAERAAPRPARARRVPRRDQTGRRGGGSAPPAPFAVDGGAAFAEWLMAPDIGPAELELSALHLQLWRMRPDLQVAFPDPGGRDAHGFRSWLDDDPSARRLHEDLCLPERRRRGGPVISAGARGERRRCAGRVRVERRRLLRRRARDRGGGAAAMSVAIEQVGIPTELAGAGRRVPASRQQHQLRRDIGNSLCYRDSLFCVNADALEGAVALTEGGTNSLDRNPEQGRRIGLWFWEVDVFPDRWNAAYDLLDEIWCASPFTADVIGAVAPIPVHTVGLPVWAPSAPTPFSRLQLGLPEGFVFLFSFDFHSVFERKNPLDVIEAHKRAFGPGDGATLVIKSINGAHHPARDAPVEARRGRPRRHRPPRRLPRRPSCPGPDPTLRLLRVAPPLRGIWPAAGRGDGPGRPVIATGYSGNMAFMDRDSAFLVPYDLVPVGPGNGPYPAAARWAAPDLDAAAGLMRTVFDLPATAGAVAERGRATVLDRQGLARASAVVGPLLAPSVFGSRLPRGAAAMDVLATASPA